MTDENGGVGTSSDCDCRACSSIADAARSTSVLEGRKTLSSRLRSPAVTRCILSLSGRPKMASPFVKDLRVRFAVRSNRYTAGSNKAAKHAIGSVLGVPDPAPVRTLLLFLFRGY